MDSHYEAHLGSGWRQRNGWAVIEGTRHPAFRMGAHLIRERASACLTISRSRRW
jgi:hypothetical protein